MYLNSFPFTHFLELFTCFGDVWNSYGGLGFGFVNCVVVGGLLGCCCDWMNLWCHWLRAQEGN